MVIEESGGFRHGLDTAPAFEQGEVGGALLVFRVVPGGRFDGAGCYWRHGHSAVRGYREAGGEGEVLLVGAEPHRPYRRPPLTKEVVLDTEFEGQVADPWGNQRAGFTATTQINRKDFGVNFNGIVDGGKVLVGDKVQIHLAIEAVLDQDA